VRVVHLSVGWTVLVDFVVWAVAGVVVGYLTHQASAQRFASAGVLTRLRPFERDGRWYEERWRIKAWKDRLPEGGAIFAGGFSKRSLRTREPDVLGRFVIETRRAEHTHWWLMALAPLFFLWNPWWLALVMIGYALIANVPCLMVQRYNRARLIRVLRRRRAAPDAG
jgi:glycosyl-4,4'-diaponeurosporenoate acyltransferase